MESVEIISVALEIMGLALSLAYLARVYVSRTRQQAKRSSSKSVSIVVSRRPRTTLIDAPLSGFHSLNREVRVGAVL